MFVKITVVLCALIAVSSAFVVTMQSGADCNKAADKLTASSSALIVTNGMIPSDKCEVSLMPDQAVDSKCHLCVQVIDWSKMSSQCNGKITFTANLKDGGKEMLEYPCQPADANKPLPAQKCFDANDIKVKVSENTTLTRNQYSFSARVTVECGHSHDHTSNGAHSEPIDEVEFENIKEAIHANRVTGIVVGVCLACVFLIILAVTYFYYKNKPYSSVPKEP